MHGLTNETELLARQVLELVLARQRQDPWPLGGAATAEELAERVGPTITPAGLGGSEALRRWVEELAPATVAADHPRYLAFIPHAPTEAAVLFDLLVGASGIYAGSWLEAAGAVYAENEALRWLADLAGFPAEAGGRFVPGGTLGNLSALHAARHAALVRRGGVRPARWKIATSAEAHSSVAQAARVLDVDLIDVPVDANHRLTGTQPASRARRHADDGLFAVVASAGATNLGVIDDLQSVAAVCRDARPLAAHRRRLRSGGSGRAERCDRHLPESSWPIVSSSIRTSGSLPPTTAVRCSTAIREQARAAHSQSAAYLDAINARDEWNPADYAVHLSRRARGLPFWFSLAVHGTDAYAEAIETTLSVTRQVAEEIRARPYLELLIEPELSVLVFRRHGWTGGGLRRSGRPAYSPPARRSSCQRASGANRRPGS